MIQVRSFDGVVHQFPDGTADDAIDKAMKNYVAERKAATPGELRGAIEGVGKQAGPGFGPLDRAVGLGRSLQQGLTMGFGDELGAGTQASLDWLGGQLGLSDPTGWGEAYDQRLGQGRAFDEKFRDYAPLAAGIAEAVGATTGALMVPGLSGVQGTSLGARMATGTATGSTLGALYAFGDAEGGFENRLENAGMGALTGGVVGGAIPGLGALGGKLTAGIRNAIGEDAQKYAARKTLDAFKADDIAIADALKEYQARLGAGMPEERLVDLGGQNVKDWTRAAMQTPGPGKQQGVEKVLGDIANEPANLAKTLGRSLGTDDYYDTIEALVKDRQAKAQPLYEAAFASDVPVDTAPILKWVNGELANAVGPQKVALTKVAKYLLDDTGNPKTTIQALDGVKKALDADYMNAGALDTAIGRGARRYLLDAKNQLVALMDKANPDYKAARAQWGGDSETIAATELGKSLLTMPEAEFRAAVKGLQPGDLFFVRLGVRQGLEEKGAKTWDTNNLVESLFRRRDVGPRLQAIFPDEASFTGFMSEIDRMREIAKTSRYILPTTGSQTNLREMSADGLAGQDLMAFTQQAASGGIKGALVNALMRPLSRFMGGKAGISADQAEAMVQMLTGKASPELINALLQSQAKAQGQQGARTVGAIGGAIPLTVGD